MSLRGPVSKLDRFPGHLHKTMLQWAPGDEKSVYILESFPDNCAEQLVW